MTKKTILDSYDKIANWFDEHRSRDLFEKDWLDRATGYLKPGAKILDLGCGMGEPIGSYLQAQGFEVVGVDGSERLLEIAKERHPDSRFILADMRELALGETFDLVIAWDSFFHLTQEDQRKMFEVFTNHLNNTGILLFTSGPEAGEVWGENGGESLYHASLSPQDYKAILQKHQFELIDYKLKDVDCQDHSIWLSQYRNNKNEVL